MALAASLLAACIPDPSEWFPTGKAGVIGFRELEEGGFKSGLVAIRLENTGRSIIRASTVSVSLETDARRYYRTVTDSASILPGGIVFTNMEFSYDSPEEKATEGEPRLENFFFE